MTNFETLCHFILVKSGLFLLNKFLLLQIVLVWNRGNKSLSLCYLIRFLYHYKYETVELAHIANIRIQFLKHSWSSSCESVMR